MTTNHSNTITSLSNPLIKRLRSLDRKKGRADSGLFLAEGTRLVSQGLKKGWKAEIMLVSNEIAERSYIDELISLAGKNGCAVVTVPNKLLAKVTRKDNPQSVVAAFHQKHQKVEDLGLAETGIWLALYEIRDPGNLGTILRTADCAMVRGVILLENCCDPYSVEAVRASMGSIFDIEFASADFGPFNAWRRSNNMSMVAASVNGTQRHDGNIYENRSVIIMGNEQAGLPDSVEAMCDTLALIPMRGGADSLNLAQATAIMTYEAWRQRGFQ